MAPVKPARIVLFEPLAISPGKLPPVSCIFHWPAW
jgi:hypothetical protein